MFNLRHSIPIIFLVLLVSCVSVENEITTSPTASIIQPTPTALPTTSTPPNNHAFGLIAYSSDQDGDFEIWLMNADGSEQRKLTDNNAMDISPAWSPDGRKLAYVSFEQGNSAIYIQDVATGARELVSSGKGINGAPSFSPDGKKMAMTLSRSGNPEIYVRDMATGRTEQITQHWSIDTEPVWSPDGRWVYFTSDRGGRPQIYRVPPSGGSPARVTLEGEYNARASISPDGRRIAVAQGRGNEYRIAVWDIETERFTVLTPGTLDESPSFAPNGSMIIYASTDKQQGVLAAGYCRPCTSLHLGRC